MAHEVESMMYAGDPPWHGLGKAVSGEGQISIPEAVKAAGLDWDVGLKPVYAFEPHATVLIPDHRAVYRTSDGSILGIVGRDYHPLQNRDAFAWFQPFLDQEQARIETAGSLRKGARIWVLARIEQPPLEVRKADEITSYLLLSNSHDGSLSVRVGFTPIRVVCNNTLCFAHRSRASKLIRVRHGRGMMDSLENIRDVMDLFRREFVATAKTYAALAGKEIHQKDLEKYIRVVFDLGDTGGEKIIPAVVHLFEAGRGSRQAGTTWWGAYNAVNEYLNYNRGRNADNRLNSLWFGEGVQLNRRALDTAVKLAA